MITLFSVLEVVTLAFRHKKTKNQLCLFSGHDNDLDQHFKNRMLPKVSATQRLPSELSVLSAQGPLQELPTLGFSKLTPREAQIVELIAGGAGNKQVAVRLAISEWTVGTHLRRIFVKLGVRSRAAMVYRYTVDRGTRPDRPARSSD